MRRSVLMTAILVLSASLACWAQRGGGFHGGGGFAGHGGMHAGGGFHGGFAGANRFGSAPVRSGFHAGGGFHSGSGFHSGTGFHHHSHGPRLIIGNFGFRRRYGRYGSYPYSYGWYGSPFWWDWASSSYDSQSDDNYVQYQLNAEINRLSDEVQELREQRDERNYQQRPPEPAPAPRPSSALKDQPEDLPVVLVFLDKRIQEVKNYAVANEMLIVLEGNHRKKYPLADIDLAATMKLNDERGVEFQIPNPVISQ